MLASTLRTCLIPSARRQRHSSIAWDRIITRTLGAFLGPLQERLLSTDIASRVTDFIDRAQRSGEWKSLAQSFIPTAPGACSIGWPAALSFPFSSSHLIALLQLGFWSVVAFAAT